MLLKRTPATVDDRLLAWESLNRDGSIGGALDGHGEPLEVNSPAQVQCIARSQTGERMANRPPGHFLRSWLRIIPQLRVGKILGALKHDSSWQRQEKENRESFHGVRKSAVLYGG